MNVKMLTNLRANHTLFREEIKKSTSKNGYWNKRLKPENKNIHFELTSNDFHHFN